MEACRSYRKVLKELMVDHIIEYLKIRIVSKGPRVASFVKASKKI